MDEIVAEIPEDEELHVILDNDGMHKKCDARLALHPNVHVHFIPASAVGSIKSRSGLASCREGFAWRQLQNISELRQATKAFVSAYNPTASPFRWRNHEASGSQLRKYYR